MAMRLRFTPGDVQRVAAMRMDLLVNDFVWRAVQDRAVVVFEGGANGTTSISGMSCTFLHAIDPSTT